MKKSLIIIVPLLFLSLSLTSAFAAGKGATPNGKPFMELNGYIHEIEGEVATLQDQIDSLIGRVDSMEEHLAANQQAILDLQETSATLQAQIDANADDIVSLETSITNLEAENANLQDQIDTLGDTDGSLQAQIDANEALITTYAQSLDTLHGSLQAQIDNNNNLIGALQTDIDIINQALAMKQNYVDGKCYDGSAIKEILPDGSVVCEAIDTGATGINTVYVLRYHPIFPATDKSIQVRCPSGYLVTGGGFFRYQNVDVMGSRPYRNSAANTWEVIAVNYNPFVVPMWAYAQCIKLSSY